MGRFSEEEWAAARVLSLSRITSRGFAEGKSVIMAGVAGVHLRHQKISILLQQQRREIVSTGNVNLLSLDWDGMPVLALETHVLSSTPGTTLSTMRKLRML